MKHKLAILICLGILSAILCFIVQNYKNQQERFLDKVFGVYEIGDTVQSNNSILSPLPSNQSAKRIVILKEFFAYEISVPSGSYLDPYRGLYVAFTNPQITIIKIDENVYHNNYDSQGGALRKMHPFSYFSENDDCYMIIIKNPNPDRQPTENGPMTYDETFFYIDGVLYYSYSYLCRLTKVE